MDITSITVVAGTALIGFFIAALLGRKGIPLLHKLKFGQTIRDVGPSWHKNKQGTPTMGGLLFIAATLLAALGAMAVCQLFLPMKITSANPYAMTRLFSGMLLAFCCGGIGFVDDYIKVVKKRNLGLTSSQKLFAQLLVSAAYATFLYMSGGGKLRVPLYGILDMGVWFIPFCMFVVVAVINATNLTDGVDGLCGTVSFLATLFFLVMAGVSGLLGQSLFAAAFAGGLAGFLVWNLHPAKVFMGDTGSLFVGGVLCALAFGVDQPLLLIPVGIIYIAENVSVIAQMLYFKLTHGKRLFKMAPLHHHFEMCGWSETKIVTVFSMITVLGCGVAAVLVWYA